MSNVLIMAGGTGGHIMPALAVARLMEKKGASVSWIGAKNGLEKSLVSEANIPFDGIDIKGLRNKGLTRKLIMPFMLLAAVYQSYKIIRKRRPDVVLGMGGFVSGPGGIVAGLLRVPIVLHEQNTVAGLTNRWLAKISTAVFTGFPVAQGIKRFKWAGNPVRREILAIPDPLQRMGQRDGPLRILVVGGSQGAQVFNDYLAGMLTHKTRGFFSVRHQCGKNNVEKVESLYADGEMEVIVEAFIDDMAQAYEWADVVICRSGAMTVSEVCAAGVVGIFVPYPYAVNDHQTINATYVTEEGAGYIVDQERFLKGEWTELLDGFSESRASLIDIANKARQLAKPGATSLVAQACWEAIDA